MLDKKTARNVRQMFFEEFAECHCEWLRKLVAKYKERGEYPIFPTQVMEYYQNPSDKVLAVLSTLCMCWDNDKILEQIASMRKLIGRNPTQWWRDREFVTISVGREQNKTIDGYISGHYWKIAKVYDILYDLCRDGHELKNPHDVLGSASAFNSFCDKVGQVCMVSDIEYKRDVISLVTRTSDGMGRNLWPTRPDKVKCPQSNEIKNYLYIWFPYWRTRMWTWEEAVSLFRLENNYDFFYAFYAHQELGMTNPTACREYLQLYRLRWDKNMTYPRYDWVGDRGRMPKIEFNDLND
jgi:hypothetical protein